MLSCLRIATLFYVVQTLDMEKFMAAHWEKKPLVFKSPGDARRKRLASLFTLSTLWDCVEKAQKAGVHYNAASQLILP